MIKSTYQKLTAPLASVFIGIALHSPAIGSDLSVDSTLIDPRVAELLAPDSLAGLYQQRIEYLELGIHNETKRRTTILGQLDGAINSTHAIQEEHDTTASHTPPIDENLRQIDDELSTLEKNISSNKMLLKELKETLQKYPEPSIWQAALGKPELPLQQKLRASERYLLHTTRKDLQRLTGRKQQLDNKRTTVTEYGKGVIESIEQLRLQKQTLLEQSHDLEDQLTRIAAEIVKKQDRVNQLRERAAFLSRNPKALKFQQLQKRLPDPIDGELLKVFAEPKAKGLLKWSGILVSAPLGIPFHAVSDGLVVFADEIHGLGNVAIVDHGDGYMSLYGMAELLMVETDQILLAGDPIGTVGESVGLGASALYFEIRHNAATLDPQDWLEMNRISQKNRL